jgi:hypothetical protein
MLGALGVIPSTAQIKINLLESSVEGLVVYFWTTFITEASFLYVLGASAACRELYSLWTRQVPACFTHTPVCFPRVIPECIRECGGANRSLSSVLAVGELGTQSFCLLVSVLICSSPPCGQEEVVEML